MNPQTGSFISMDTYQGNAYDPASLHKYTYAQNNPEMYNDPSGHSGKLISLTTCMAIGAVLTGLLTIQFALLNNMNQNILSSLVGGGQDILSFIHHNLNQVGAAATMFGSLIITVLYEVIPAAAISIGNMLETSSVAAIVTAIVCGATGNDKENAAYASLIVVHLVSAYLAYGMSTVIEVLGERGTAKVEVEENGEVTVEVEDLPENVQDSLEDYEKNEWKRKSNKTKGTNEDSPFGNKEGRLPEKDAQGNDIKYREHDVNNKENGIRRDKQRFVTGNDGSVYYTNDHYGTFVKIR